MGWLARNEVKIEPRKTTAPSLLVITEPARIVFAETLACAHGTKQTASTAAHVRFVTFKFSDPTSRTATTKTTKERFCLQLCLFCLSTAAASRVT